MTKQEEITECPFCGSDFGFCVRNTSVYDQYYDWNLDATHCVDIDGKTNKTYRCGQCDANVTKFVKKRMKAKGKMV